MPGFAARFNSRPSPELVEGPYCSRTMLGRMKKYSPSTGSGKEVFAFLSARGIGLTMIDLLDWLAAADPQRPFLKHPDGRIVTYGQLRADVPKMAGALAVRGVQAGDRVTVQVEKCPEYLTLYVACLWIGAVFMPLNTGYTQAEVDYFVGDAEPKLFLTDLADLIAESETAEAALRAAVDPDAQAAMLYTSGTTGRPKGAIITRRNLASNAASLAELWRFTQEDVLLHALPVFHTHGLFVATNTVLAAGASMLWLDKFSATTVLSLLPQASVLMGVPTFYTRLLLEDGLGRDVVSTMRLFISGSAPLLAETHHDFAKRTGHAILERYGMTETQMITSNPYDGERIAGTVGFPLPGVELRIAEPDAQGIGTIEVRGPNVCAGYWRNPEKTAADFRGDGFFITGDLGRVDERGYVHIVGRGKDLIISGGLNIYPKEIETEIDALPGVIESAVIGIAEADFGEAVVAVVVGPGLEPDAIRAALSERLARFKLPKAVHIVEELPRNAMGKVQKAVLREMFGG
jgi:malonyl-CoA/methylmalonyl-CoA synthetase